MNNQDFFSVIPGFEHAGKVPVVQADELQEKVFTANYVNYNQPVLIKKAVTHWPAFTRWRNPEYWTTACSDFKLSVFSHGNFMNADRQRNGSMATTFHQAITRLFDNDGTVFSMPSHNISPGKGLYSVIGDVTGFPFLPSPLKPRMYDEMRLFLYRGAGTNWHYHSTDETLMCQVKGGKRVMLFGPDVKHAGEITKFLFEEKQLEGGQLDASYKVDSFIVDVEEGDSLYIPPYWHHAVITLDNEVGFTLAYCWRSPWHKMGDFSNFFVRRLFAEAMWPLKKISLIIPFFALRAMFSFLNWKLFTRQSL